MRFALDSNILVYALIRDDEAKHAVASRILLRSIDLDAVIPAQVVAEYLNVVRRKHPEYFRTALDQAERWAETLTILPTTIEDIVNGGEFALKHRMQLWDAVIWQVARSARAALLVSEDLQDGLSIEGLRVLNPFISGNADELDKLLKID